MRFLIGTIFFILIFGVALPILPLIVMDKREGIDWRVFRRVRVGKLSCLFDFRNAFRVKDEGIILPFFIMFVMAYLTVLYIVVMTIIYFAVRFESVAEMDFTLLIWLTIGVFSDFVLNGIILFATIITSKVRLKDIDRLNPKK